MVEETNFEGKIVYKCMECGWMYKDITFAKKCERWCRKHKSCNLNLVKHAIKIK